jgi:hypothetical protein
MPRFQGALASFFLFAMVPAEARAPATAMLGPGEQVVLVFDDGGVPQVDGRGAAEALSPFDAAAVRELLTNHSYAIGPNSAALSEEQGLPTPQPVPARQIRLRFIRMPADHTLLVIENGFPSGLRYRAKMTRGDKVEATDVCTVLPLKRGYEVWPYRIDRLELSGFALFPMQEGDPPTCE